MLLLDHEPRLAAMGAAPRTLTWATRVWWPSFENMPNASPTYRALFALVHAFVEALSVVPTSINASVLTLWLSEGGN